MDRVEGWKVTSGPQLRGPLSETMCSLLLGHSAPEFGTVIVDDPLSDDDLHLALFLGYELHYRSLNGIDDRVEWNASMLAFREALELPFEVALKRSFGRVPTCEPIDQQLRDMVNEDQAPPLSSFMAREASIDMYREFVTHRSLYHRREADPHSFAIPRLRGKAKVAMMEIQSDEYGGGDAARMHSALFGDTMRGLGLDPGECAHVDRLPGVTLATMNLMSLFGLHRRLTGAIVGHLAAFEMTSCIPNRRYADGLRRLGFDETTTRYFDEHVEADAAHAAIAANDLAGSLLDDEPALADDVVFGASALLGLEGRWAQHVLSCWELGVSSLIGIGESDVSEPA